MRTPPSCAGSATARLRLGLEIRAIGPRQKAGEPPMLTVYDAAEGALIKREAPAAITSAAVWIDLLNPDQGRGPAGRAGAVDLRADARGDVRDRGLEPPLSGGRRALHDGHRAAPAGRAERAADRHAGHLHSGRQPARHGALRRAARLPDLPQPRAEEGRRLHDAARPSWSGCSRPSSTARPTAWSASRARSTSCRRPSSAPKAATARASRRFDVNIRTIGREGELTSRSREMPAHARPAADLSRRTS